jgi:hypothetical protein
MSFTSPVVIRSTLQVREFQTLNAIGGAPAPINFISPGQINIITQPTVAPGSNIPVVVAQHSDFANVGKNGIETDKVYWLSPTSSATFGSASANIVFGGLIPSFSEVYQFNVTIPSNAPNGDSPPIVTVNGTPSVSGLIAVQGS